MSKYVSKYAVCPFYRRHDDNRICCEGVTRDSSVNLVFRSQIRMKRYTTIHCESMEGCKQCRVYGMLDGKYQEKDT